MKKYVNLPDLTVYDEEIKDYIYERFVEPNQSDWNETDSSLLSYIKNKPNYAGSSTAGGAAISANKINTDAGSTYKPVYFSNGVPVSCGTANEVVSSTEPTGQSVNDTWLQPY